MSLILSTVLCSRHIRAQTAGCIRSEGKLVDARDSPQHHIRYDSFHQTCSLAPVAGRQMWSVLQQGCILRPTTYWRMPWWLWVATGQTLGIWRGQDVLRPNAVWEPAENVRNAFKTTDFLRHLPRRGDAGVCVWTSVVWRHWLGWRSRSFDSRLLLL